MFANSGHVIDLDLKTWICTYDVSTVTDSPDGRRWGFASLKQEQVAAHGGALLIDSARTQGTRLVVRLPLQRQMHVAAARAVGIAGVQRHLHLLHLLLLPSLLGR